MALAAATFAATQALLNGYYFDELHPGFRAFGWLTALACGGAVLMLGAGPREAAGVGFLSLGGLIAAAPILLMPTLFALVGPHLADVLLEYPTPGLRIAIMVGGTIALALGLVQIGAFALVMGAIPLTIGYFLWYGRR
ncbi:hypothetical protein [Jannaschia sp. LMIT008]|uniref:hypothetical protein n=1 Tax=Jannaschia maritima TaxID=3032585 RepID=UPI0028113F06|nr:hypothetical protein [Jannaschia sp. LMIT008]